MHHYWKIKSYICLNYLETKNERFWKVKRSYDFFTYAICWLKETKLSYRSSATDNVIYICWKKNKKAKFKNKVLLSHLELPSKTPCQVKLMLLDFTKKLDWSKLIQITHRSNCNFTYLIWGTTLNEHPPCWWEKPAPKN